MQFADCGQLGYAWVLRAEAGHAKAEPELGIPVTEGLSVAATMPLVMSGLPQTSAIPAVTAPMHHNLHASNMQHTMRGTDGNTSDATAGSDKETNSKAEIRRARRWALPVCLCLSQNLRTPMSTH